jgi:tetratricopeptide (TPR) repeat protein
VLAAVLVWNSYKNHSNVRVLLAWTAILLIPSALAVTTFITDEWVHDRHTYVASIPFCLLIARLLADVCQPAKRLVLVSSAILLLLAVDTYYQVPRFEDELSVYTSALRIAPTNASLHRFYAVALWTDEQYEPALREYRAVIDLEPNSPQSHGQYAMSLAEIGRNTEALSEYQEALQLAPAASPLRASLLYRSGQIESGFSRLDEAAAHLREATQIDPRAINYHAALADILRKKGNTRDADEELRIEATNRKQYLEKQRRATGQ